MRLFCFVFVAATGLLLASCSEKSDAADAGKPTKETDRHELAAAKAGEETEADNEKSGESKEEEVDPEEIGEDCVAFLRATHSTPPGQESMPCPQCPGGSANPPEVLKFDNFQINKSSTSGDTRVVDVTIQAHFNPSARGNIVGGLVGWIPLEQRKQYTEGKTPSGGQVYKVRVVYKRAKGVWRAVEFAKRDS